LRCRYKYAGGDQVFDLCSSKHEGAKTWSDMPPVLQPEVSAGGESSDVPLPTWSYRRGVTVSVSEKGRHTHSRRVFNYHSLSCHVLWLL
jgi:hypothetical protein